MGSLVFIVQAGVLGLSLASVAFVLSSIASGRKTFLFVSLVWLMGLGPVVREIGAPRNLGITADQAQLLASVSSTEDSLWSWVSRLLTAMVILLCALGIAHGILKRNGRLPVAGLTLWLGLILFSAGPLVSSIMGTKPAFNYDLLLLPLALTAVYLLPTLSLPRFVRHAKLVLLVYMYGSLLAAIAVPDWAFERGYEGLVPGLDLRLYGLGYHPNYLGPLAVLYLILEWFRPTQGFIKWTNLSSALLVLLLTQSKTAWLIAVVVLALKTSYEMYYIPRRRFFTTVVLTSLIIAVVALSGLLILPGDYASVPVTPERMQELRTLTGRTEIWRIALTVWKQNPVFGYGHDLWSFEFRIQYGVWANGAHNQFIQSLVETGLLGFVFLLAYLIALVSYGLRYAKVTRGVSLAVVVFLLLQSLTDTPFRNYSIDQLFFIHFICFVFLLLTARQRHVGEVGKHAAMSSGSIGDMSQPARQDSIEFR